MLKDRDLSRLLTGTGPDTFFYALTDWQATSGQSLIQKFDSPHNEYLAMLSNLGLPALLLYCGLILLAIRRSISSSPELAAAVLCYALQAFFSFSVCIVSPLLWVCLGCGCFSGKGMPS